MARVIAFLLAMTLAAPVFSAEPYFITLQKLELKKSSGEWVDIIEPDKKVDLVSTEPAISFFNNGRVPTAEFNNFRISFDDHGKTRQIWRTEDLESPVKVKKGSFIHVSFDLGLEKAAKVHELRLTVDEDERVDSGEVIADTGKEKG